MLFIGGGYSQGRLSNQYTLTDLGTSTYPSSPAEYKEGLEGDALSFHVGLGTEFLLLDNVTLMFEGGYRYMLFDELKHQDALVTVNGNVAKGASAIDSFGAQRDMDLSGFFIGLNFRIYIPPL